MRRNRGFTLVELLVVISIIAILASIVLTNLDAARKKSRDGRRVADIKQMQLALSLYNNDWGSYPSQTTLSAGVPSLAPNYISILPLDPLNSGSGCSGGSDYKYCYWSNGIQYVLQTHFELSTSAVQQGTTTNANGLVCTTSGATSFYCVSN